tara:strand:+ start:2062 stop:3879 length:1818 start_codon:yes stop_codon:yes gene_type:complete
MSTANYNIDDYSIEELMKIFNINALTKESIEQNIHDYMKSVNTKQEQQFIEKAKQKLFNSLSHTVMLSRNNTPVVTIKDQEESADTLNPVYRNIVTRIINVDSKFRSNTLPLSNEKPDDYNVPVSVTTTNACLFKLTSSTNYVALFTDQLSDILSLQLINYSIPYTWYNIDTTYFNNFFKLKTKAQDSLQLITIDSGNYNLYGSNIIYDTINEKLKTIRSVKTTNSMITFSYNTITAKTEIHIYKQLSNTDDFYYHFIWFDKTNLNVKSNNTLGYKLGFRQFETRFSSRNTTISNELYKHIYLQLKPITYSPLLQDAIMMEPIKKELEPYSDCSGKIYYTNNMIDLYITKSNQFNITYNKDLIYTLSSDSSLAVYFNYISTGDNTDSSLNPTSWIATSGEHLINQTLYTQLKNVNFQLTPYLYSSYTSEANADLTLTKYLLLGIDDYQNNRINSGLVSIESVESYIDVKKLDTTQLKVDNCQFADTINYSRQYTNKLEYGLQTTTNATLQTINALEKSKNKVQYSSKSPTVDVFAVIKIPLDNTLNWGQLITDDNIFQNHYIRKYFGPVSLNSFKVSLYTEDGFIVNLNDSNWNFSILCKQLYKY